MLNNKKEQVLFLLTFILLLNLSVLFIPSVSASTPYNFEGFEDSDINNSDFDTIYAGGGSGWASVTTLYHSGSRSAGHEGQVGASYMSPSAYDTYYNVTASEGSLSFWMYIDAHSGDFWVELDNDVDDIDSHISFEEDLQVDWNNGTNYASLATYSIDEWLYIECYYDYADLYQNWTCYDSDGNEVFDLDMLGWVDDSDSQGTQEHIDLVFRSISGINWVYIDDVYNPAEDYFGSSSPTPTPSPTYWFDDSNFATIGEYMAILILMFVPSYVLGYMFKMGQWGYITGLVIGTGLAYVSFPASVPVWLIFLIALGIIGLLYREFGG